MNMQVTWLDYQDKNNKPEVGRDYFVIVKNEFSEYLYHTIATFRPRGFWRLFYCDKCRCATSINIEREYVAYYAEIHLPTHFDVIETPLPK